MSISQNLGKMPPEQMPPCCVPKCKNTQASRYNFPEDKKICDIWLQRTKQPSSVDPKNIVICAEHFQPTSIESGGALNNKSVPSLNLPSCKNRPHVTRTYLMADAEIINAKLKIFEKLVIRREIQNFSLSTKIKILEDRPKLLRMLKYLNTLTVNFILSQMSRPSRKSKQRRFTNNDKLLALPIYKQSGEGYRYLSKLFNLPSKNTLEAVLPLRCGIQDHVFTRMKTSVAKRLYFNSKYCVLIFDDFPIKPGMQYNPYYDSIEGLVDFGENDRRLAFADRALVFLLKGIYCNWEQPICFSFCEYPISRTDLVHMIEKVVEQVQALGLHIVASVCDHAGYNVRAVNYLINESREYYSSNNTNNNYGGYFINNREIVHLYDYPHLFKSLRNDLLIRDLHFTQDGEKRLASWSDIIDIYNVDLIDSLCARFTYFEDEHILPSCINKSKVRYCTEVFSHRLGAWTYNFAVRFQDRIPQNISPKAVDTAHLVVFLDRLFDSMNGSHKETEEHKKLRHVVKYKSGHFQFWKKALPILKSMYFSSPESNEHIITSSLKKLPTTVRGFLRIRKKLYLSFLLVGSFQQEDSIKTRSNTILQI